MKISRRDFLHTSCSAVALTSGGFLAAPKGLADHTIPAGGYPLVLPPEFTGGVLEAKAVTKEIWPGFPTTVLALNGSLPGPTIRLKKGDRFKARIQNSLGESLVIHWHGILAPSKMDGNLSVCGQNRPGSCG